MMQGAAQDGERHFPEESHPVRADYIASAGLNHLIQYSVLSYVACSYVNL